MKHRKWRDPDDHPTPQLLLLQFEGELSPEDALAVREHLQRCWTCRTYSEGLERGIRRFVEHREELIRGGVPRPPSRWHGFSARLDEMSGEISKPNEVIAGFRAALHPFLRPAPILASCVAVVFTALLAKSIFQSTPAVTPPPRRIENKGAVVPPAPAKAPPRALASFRLPALPAPEGPIVAPPSGRDLAEAEWHTRFVLHRLGADLGEDLRFQTSPDGVTLAGIVDSPDRRARLIEELRDTPYLTIQLRTVDEMIAPVPPEAAADPGAMSAPAPAFAKELDDRFPQGAARAAFVNRVLSASGHASSEAYALRALLDRYDAGALALLSEASLAQIEQVLRSETSAIADSEREVAGAIRPFLETSSPYPANSDKTADWRQHLAATAALAIELHERTLEGFAGSSADRPPDSLRRALAQELQSMEALLQPIRLQLEQPFLHKQPEEK